ncbi:MAG: response regulator [Frankiaceae bacterium]|nr:response regulator [Frankiaceae bacterium]MBV9873052.1 response regulator [Frankiaceae bacterium]
MKARVLVVDDEFGMRETLVAILETAGYDVSQAGDGAAALATAQSQTFDVIVMDIRMPELTGVEVLASLTHPPPQIILMTAYALEEQLRIARDNDAFAIMEKPFQVPYLLSVVEQAAAAAAA